MRNQEDPPYIVVERDSGGSFGSFCLGALVGAGLALLFAPQTGEETQEEIRARAQKLRAAAEERMREAQLTLEDRFENVREGVESRVELVRDAVESGRAAAEVARTDLEAKLERSKAAAKAGIAAARESAVDGKSSQEEDVGE